MDRPLSPHLTIYKPQITSVLSILHRITGAVLSSVFFIFIAWILLLAAGERYEAQLNLIFQLPFLMPLLILTSAIYFYHLSTGIRHIFWDFGLGFKLATVRKTGVFAISMTLVLTILFWSKILFL